LLVINKIIPFSLLLDTGDYFAMAKQPECKADCSPPSTVKVKNPWSFISMFPHAVMAMFVSK
jgi:hypothetical protein